MHDPANEFRRIPLLGTWLNKAHFGRIEPPAQAINTVALDGSAYTLQAIFASIRERTMYLIGGFGA